MTSNLYYTGRDYLNDEIGYGRHAVSFLYMNYISMEIQFQNRGPLEWRPKSRLPEITKSKENSTEADLDKEISELRLGLQAEKEREEQLWQEINSALKTSGGRGYLSKLTLI